MEMKIVIKLISLVVILGIFNGCNIQQEEKADGQNVVPSATEFKPTNEAYTRKLHGQLVYVPIYSSIYDQHESNLLHMTSILSIRNTSIKEAITIKRVEYYDTNGKLLKIFIDSPFSLGKMSTKDFVIPEHDIKGGTGANFIGSSHLMVFSPR